APPAAASIDCGLPDSGKKYVVFYVEYEEPYRVVNEQAGVNIQGAQRTNGEFCVMVDRDSTSVSYQEILDRPGTPRAFDPAWGQYDCRMYARGNCTRRVSNQAVKEHRDCRGLDPRYQDSWGAAAGGENFKTARYDVAKTLSWDCNGAMRDLQVRYAVDTDLQKLYLYPLTPSQSQDSLRFTEFPQNPIVTVELGSQMIPIELEVAASSDTVILMKAPIKEDQPEVFQSLTFTPAPQTNGHRYTITWDTSVGIVPPGDYPVTIIAEDDRGRTEDLKMTFRVIITCANRLVVENRQLDCNTQGSQCKTECEKEPKYCLFIDNQCQETKTLRGSDLIQADITRRYQPPKGSRLLPPCAFDGTCQNINDILEVAIKYGKFAFGMIGALAFIMFVYGGLMMILSMGSPERVKTGRNALIAAVVGLVVAFSAYLLIDFVLDAFRVSEGFRGIR
ncbi:MAG: pilin, partial [Patescibacteria group bacterium]